MTKYAGGVLKGFALIAGIILTGFVQWAFEGKTLGANTWVAVLLVSISIYLHSNFPVQKQPLKQKPNAETAALPQKKLEVKSQ